MRGEGAAIALGLMLGAPVGLIGSVWIDGKNSLRRLSVVILSSEKNTGNIFHDLD